MGKQQNQPDTYTESEWQAIDYLWNKKQFEEAITITRRLLRLKPRHPLYYLILSDCYRAIAGRDNDIKAAERSRMYWDKAYAFDGKFIRSDYWQQGIELAARYLLDTQDPEILTDIDTNKFQNLSTKQLTPGELYDVLLEQASVSKNPTIRLAILKRDLSLAKAGLNQNLYAFDSEGKLVNPTLQEFIRIKINNPKRQLFFALSYKDPLTKKETEYIFNILKHFNLETPSESVIKSRQRRQRYYYKKIDGIEVHRQQRKEYQKLYDSKNRERKRVRNKLDYSWRKSGLTKGYYPRDPIE